MTVYTLGTLHKWADKIEANVDDLAKNLAFSAFEGVTQRSPVDTGRFKGSWQIKQGSPNLRVLPEGSHSTSGQGEPRKVQGVAESEPGLPWFITNNLDYGPALEDGNSRQAPNGMVKLTMADLKRFVRQEVRKLQT